jgi:hypothetical protein
VADVVGGASHWEQGAGGKNRSFELVVFRGTSLLRGTLVILLGGRPAESAVCRYCLSKTRVFVNARPWAVFPLSHLRHRSAVSETETVIVAMYPPACH